MPDSIRRRLRDRAIATLTGLATTGAHVWPVREHRPLGPDELPALLVLVDDGRAGITRSSFGSTERMARLVIEAIVRQDDAYDDVMEAVLAEVEVALAADPTLGGAMKAFDEFTLGTKRTEPVGEIVVVRQVIEVQCVWYAPFGAPDVSL
jgi:hypothetical protein